jgi:hypothetical protein
MDAEAKEKKQKKEFKKRLRFLINQNDFKGAADYIIENRLKHSSKFRVPSENLLLFYTILTPSISF